MLRSYAMPPLFSKKKNQPNKYFRMIYRHYIETGKGRWRERTRSESVLNFKEQNYNKDW